jgi:APA family basic amino acid/polyamine antiporter
MSTFPEAPGRPKLKRSLGLWMATALVVGNMIGSGWVLLPASLASTAGPLSILAWVFTGVGAILLALVFANLGRALPRTGGPYAYARRAFGDFAGFWTAWGYWIAAWVGNVAIVTAFVSYGGVFWSPLNSGGASYSKWIAAGVALAVLWLLTLVNVVGVREAGLVQTVTTVLKFVPLLAIGLVGLFFIHGGNYTPFAPDHHTLWSQFTAISAAGTLTLWAFIGLESATVPAEEVKDPERTLPRATIIGTVAATVMYIVATVAIMGILPAGTLANSGAPFADAARAAWGSTVLGVNPAKVIAAIALVSTFGCLNGWILLQGRVPLAAARDRLFPKQFAMLSERGGTPVFGLVVSSVLMSLLIAFTYSGRSALTSIFTQVVLLATLTTIVPYAFSAAAQLQLMFQERDLFNPRHFIRDAGIAVLAFLYAFWMVWGSGHQTVAQGFLLLLAGIPVYVYMKWRQSLEQPVLYAPEPEPELPPAEAEAATH